MNSNQNQQPKTFSASNCKFCNRALKNLESIKLGYGICCAKKNGLIEEKKKKIIISQTSHNLFEY